MALRGGTRANLIVDCGLICGASFAGTRGGTACLVTASVTLVFWLVSSRAIRHYDVWRAQQGLGGDLALASLLVAATTATVAILDLFTNAEEVGSFALVLWPSVLWVRLMIPGVRALVAQDPDVALIVGAGPLAHHTGESLAETPGWNVCGYLALPAETPHARLASRLLGTTHDLEKVLRERPVSKVYVAGSALR